MAWSKPMCGCEPPCRAWTDLQRAEKTVTQFERQIDAAYEQRRQAKAGWVRHLDAVGQEAIRARKAAA